MRIRITNPDGDPSRTSITNVETGEPLDAVMGLELKMSHEQLEATLTMLLVPIDLVAQVVGIRLHDDFAEIEIDKRTHSVAFVGETEDRVCVQIRKL